MTHAWPGHMLGNVQDGGLDYYLDTLINLNRIQSVLQYSFNLKMILSIHARYPTD